MRLLRSRSQWQEGRRGVSLTEIVIVVGIIGIILGAIWAAAGSVFTRNKIRTADQELLAISENTRATFAEQGGVTNSGGGLTKALDQLNVFPLDMRLNASTPSGIIFHPWSQVQSGTFGSVQVGADTCSGVTDTTAAPEPCFNITFTAVPQLACISLLMETTENAAGVIEVLVGGTVAGTAGAPITANAAATACSAANNTILWVYSVKQSSS